MSPHPSTSDLSGRQFGQWHVVSWSKRQPSGKQLWLCRCKCGVEKEVESYNLTSGRSESCRKCSAAVVGRIFVKHGMSRHVVYRRWQAMKTRCTNPKAKSWKHHGGAGVKVADEWLENFEAFYKHIGDPPTPLHTIDRHDSFGDYAPGNVRWATQAEQMDSTRRAAKYDSVRWPHLKGLGVEHG